jgi:thiol-disulfide isomerase/thioredoxin
MRRSIMLLFAVLLIAGCGKKDSFSIRGEIKNRKRDYIYLSRIDVNVPVLLDSAKVKDSGKFRFRIKASGPEFYQLGYPAGDFITLLANAGEKIKLNFPADRLSSSYTVEGSEGTEQVRYLDSTLAVTRRKLDSLTAVYTKASKEPGFENRKPELEKQYFDIVREQRKKNIAFIVSHVNSMASIKALYQRINDGTYVLYEPRDLQYMKIVSDSLGRKYPESKNIQALARDLKKELDQMYMRQLKEMTDTMPETKLDPDLIDINGHRAVLSSLRGRYVLVSFWSARSKECIAENLQMKELYKNFRKKGFEIYQINLDQNEEEWKAAVKFDELPWINVREKNPQNPFYASLFNVKSLPANYLFNPKGEIIAIGLHGKALELKLNQIFNK